MTAKTSECALMAILMPEAQLEHKLAHERGETDKCHDEKVIAWVKSMSYS